MLDGNCINCGFVFELIIFFVFKLEMRNCIDSEVIDMLFLYMCFGSNLSSVSVDSGDFLEMFYIVLCSCMSSVSEIGGYL